MCHRLAIPALLTVALLSTSAPAWAVDAASSLARGDAAWAARARGQIDGKPDPARILEAVQAYRIALEAAPDSLLAGWSLLRALYFQGGFSERDEERKKAIFDQGCKLAERALNRLALRANGRRLEKLSAEELRQRFAGERDVPRLYYWAALHWGLWADEHGILGAVRQGVARRFRDYAAVVVALEPEYAGGGAHRLLARLHMTAPRIPFLTGWIDRDRILPEIQAARAIAPEDPRGDFLLGIALLQRQPEREAEAVELLESVVSREPRPEMLIEDLDVREDARRNLEALRERESD